MRGGKVFQSDTHTECGNCCEALVRGGQEDRHSEAAGTSWHRLPELVLTGGRCERVCVCVIFTGLFLADYVLALEAEIRTLKHKFKTLEEHLEDVLDPLKMSSPRAESQPSVRTSTETTGESPRLTGLLAVPL